MTSLCELIGKLNVIVLKESLTYLAGAFKVGRKDVLVGVAEAACDTPGRFDATQATGPITALAWPLPIGSIKKWKLAC